MIKPICEFCHKEVSMIYIGFDSKDNREYYICNECLKNKIYPEIGRDADADMHSVPQTFDDNNRV